MTLALASLGYTRHGGWSAPFPQLDSASTLVLVFGGRSYEDDAGPLRELRAAFASSVLLGCSTAGEIHGERVLDESLAVCAARFERTALRRVQAEVGGAAGSFAAGAEVGRALAGEGLRGVLVLSEGLAINGSELSRGLRGALPPGVAVAGGLAGDGPRFERTWTLGEGGEMRSGLVTAVGFYGGAEVSHGSRGGWDVFGPQRRVTRSAGNVLYELDGKPALALYKHYLGDRAAGLPAAALRFPLELRPPSGGQGVVRTILGVDEEAQSMTFAGDIPEGFFARLMRANFDRLIDGAQEAAQSAPRRAGEPALVVAISCVGRRLVLGERVDEEVEVTLQPFSAGTRQIGMYSYGELSPLGGLGCELHNQTMTLAVIQEGP